MFLGTSRVRITVYDLKGRLVRVVTDRVLAAGEHEAVWDGRNEKGQRVGSGVYFCRMEAGSFEETREISVEAFPVTCAWSAEGVVWGEDWQSGEGAWDERRGSISSVVTDEHPVLAVDLTPVVDHWLRADAPAQGLVLVPFIPEPTGELAAPPSETSLRVWYTGARHHQPGPNGH